jgi:hypothetical protein
MFSIWYTDCVSFPSRILVCDVIWLMGKVFLNTPLGEQGVTSPPQSECGAYFSFRPTVASVVAPLPPSVSQTQLNLSRTAEAEGSPSESYKKENSYVKVHHTSLYSELIRSEQDGCCRVVLGEESRSPVTQHPDSVISR